MGKLRRPWGGGFSAVEVMVAVMVAATIGIPLLVLLFQERDSEQRSRFEYLAIVAARDAAYQARAVVACGQGVDKAKRDNKALEKNPLEELKEVFLNKNPPTLTEYSADQKRVTVEVKFDPPLNPTTRAQLGTVSARWVDPELAKQDKRRTSFELTFGVLRPPGAP